MVGSISEFFCYRAEDSSVQALLVAATLECPILGDRCTKRLSDGLIAGVCAIKPVTTDPVICCPIRLYADQYQLLRSISHKVWGAEYKLVPGRDARDTISRFGKPVIGVFGKQWGGELRLPKKDGHGNYFVDWILALLSETGELVEWGLIATHDGGGRPIVVAMRSLSLRSRSVITRLCRMPGHVWLDVGVGHCSIARYAVGGGVFGVRNSGVLM